MGMINVSSAGVARSILDLIYPPRCAGCRRRGHWVCDHCLARFPLEEDQVCKACGRSWCTCAVSRGRETTVYSFAPYTDWLRQAIISFKYEGEWARKDHLGLLLVPTLESLQPTDLLVAVPLHERRERDRGYNQARLLAAVASASLGTPVIDALVRSRDTPRQVHLTGSDRRINVVSAFEAIGGLEGAHVVLIDDVVTTGATIDACADALRHGGAASVRAVTLAYG